MALDQGSNPEQTEKAAGRLGLVLLIYLVLAVSYSIIVPIGRGADEWAHYWYAQFIAEHGRLPNSVAERETAGYKSDWPPLYHLFAALITAPVETDGPPTFKYRADNVRRRLVPASGPEAILHTQDETFPWRQEILVWHLGRFLSIIFTTGTLLVTYRIALEVFGGFEPLAGQHPPDKHLLAIATVAVLAFNPRFLFTGMLFNYDSLTLLLASLFLWLSLRIVSDYETTWTFWGLGALAGLALVTKYLAAPLILVIVILGMLQPAREQFSRRRFRVISRLVQAGAAFVVVTAGWFAYLLTTFNEIERYGPLLGTLAPLIRGDGSDRTVEALFARLSGGQGPAPAFIDRQSYTAWQIIAELPTTFWGNPVVRPYPLNWFIVSMTIITLLAGLGLIRVWQDSRGRGRVRHVLFLLIIYVLLPAPFMIVRLFGARDALEAVQGRHILFLAGAAFAVLFVWGVTAVTRAHRVTLFMVLVLLLGGALHQLIFMTQAYPALLPVTTLSYRASPSAVPNISLPNEARLVDYHLATQSSSLRVDMIWQAGDVPAGEDYQLELALVDGTGQRRAGWRAIQTQARYPSRAWEPGDTIWDTGWLPLAGLPPGEYDLQWRVVGREEIVPWQSLAPFDLAQTIPSEPGWTVWHNGEPSATITGRERQTVQITNGDPLPAQNLQLIGPDGRSREPITAGPTWANFIIAPDWPAGDYRIAGAVNSPVVRVIENDRTFAIPEIWQPLTTSFEDKIKLLGYNLPSRRATAGEGLPVTLFWQGQEWLGEDLIIFSRLLDGQGNSVGGYDRLAQENYSTLLWAPGEVIIDGFAVPISPDAPDGTYWLAVGWYRNVEGVARSLPIIDPATSLPTDQTSVTIGPIKVGGSPPGSTVEQAQPESKIDRRLGKQISLLGVDGIRDVVEAQTGLQLTFYWAASGPIGQDYTRFVHLRDMAGKVVTQQDAPPLDGNYPTSLWDADEIVLDPVPFPLDQVPSGHYQLVAGLYDFTTNQRLPVTGSPDNAIVLGEIEVR